MPDHSTYNEQLLLTKTADGDEPSFSILFKNYFNLLGDYILRITESEPLTQEIVQDVFMKIWINRTALKNIECFKAYLFVIAKNHAFNCLKQIAREQSRRKEWVHSVLHNAVSNDEENDGIDPARLIDEAVDQLPAQQKKVYTLSRKNGIRHQQIARELNISHETVKKHMVLAIRFLKHYLRSNIGPMLLIVTGFFNK